MQGQRAAAEVIEAARPARPRPRRRRDRRRPRRRLGRGPAAVLRRGPGPRGARGRAPRSSPRSATSRTSPLLDLVADVRASTPTDAAKLVVPDVAEEAQQRARGPATGAAGRRAACSAREQHRPRRPALPAGPGRPAHRLDARADEVDGCASAPGAPRAHRSTAPTTTSATSVARVRALSPLATLRRGYAVLQDADGHVVTSRRRADRGRPVTVRVADGRIARHRRPARDRSTAPTHRRPTETHDARDEHAQLRGGPRRAHRGGAHASSRAAPRLEESLALWERGEELATICQDWLDGARQRLDAAMEARTRTERRSEVRRR